MTLRLAAWETTAACNLACAHCRAEARTEPDPDELSTGEVKALVNDIAAMPRPGASRPVIFIISGGEPLLRPDVFEIAAHSTAAGLHTVLATNGTLLDQAAVTHLREAGVRRLSVSLDGPGPESHDVFRGVPGAFDRAAAGLAEARAQGLPVQINTTVTRRNAGLLPEMLEKAVELGAVAWDVFMLVPTGRGTAEPGVSAAEYERILHWVARTSFTAPVEVKVTCGPHYARVWRRLAGGADGGDPLDRTRGRPGAPSGPGDRGARRHGHGRGGAPRAPGGCLAGDGFVFVSRTGDVRPCGYLPLSAGSVRQRPLSDIYVSSGLFAALRDPGRRGGKCGRCEYGPVCRGCRARALAQSGDYLAEEPLCLWKPRPSAGAPGAAGAALDGVEAP